MRIIYNIIMIVTAFPILFSFISIFIAIYEANLYNEISKWILVFLAIAVFGFFCSLFMYFYRLRLRWMLTIGIYKSWSIFKAYMIEGHDPVSVSFNEIENYKNWVTIPEHKISTQFDRYLTRMKPIYQNIIIEYKGNKITKAQMESLVHCYILHLIGGLKNEENYKDFKTH